MADNNEIEVKTDDFEVEIEPVQGNDAINIMVEAVNDGNETQKEIEAMAEDFDYEEDYQLEVAEQLGETITTDLADDAKEAMEETFGDDIEKETIPTDQVTELVPEVFFQEESPVGDANGPSKESVEASTLEGYNEELEQEFEQLEDLQEEEEVTNMVEETVDKALQLTFDGTDQTTLIPENDNLEAE